MKNKIRTLTDDQIIVERFSNNEFVSPKISSTIGSKSHDDSDGSDSDSDGFSKSYPNLKTSYTIVDGEDTADADDTDNNDSGDNDSSNGDGKRF